MFSDIDSCLAQQLAQSRPIDQLDPVLAREPLSLRREPPGASNDGGIRAFVMHYPEEFANDRDSDLLVRPVLALHNRATSVLLNFQINPAVGTGPSPFDDSKAQPSVYLGYQFLKVLPVPDTRNVFPIHFDRRRSA